MNDSSWNAETAFKKYALAIGLLVGFLLGAIFIYCFFVVGSNEASISDQSLLLQEDYLRLAVKSYAADRNDETARWRFRQIGDEGLTILNVLKKDVDTDPLSLLYFAQIVTGDVEAVFDMDTASENVDLVNTQQKHTESTEFKETTSDGARSVISTLLVVLLIVVLLLIAAIVYMMFKTGTLTPPAFVNRQTRSKTADVTEQNFSEQEIIAQALRPKLHEEIDDLQPIQEMLYTAGKTDIHLPQRNATEENEEIRITRSNDSFLTKANQNEVTDIDTIVTNIETPLKKTFDELEKVSRAEAEKNVVDAEKSVFNEADVPVLDSDDEEKDQNEGAAETDNDQRSDLESKNDLLEEISEETETDEFDKMIRQSQKNVHLDDIPALSPDVEQKGSDSKSITEDTDNSGDDPLVHFQTTFQLGDDMFDESFPLEEEDLYYGECGIGIAETINSSDPKAVTAFELWLFDRTDNRTPTHFLLSDYAMNAPTVSDRMKTMGKCDRIDNGKTYEITTQSLRMSVTVMTLEYGREMADKNSYFTKVSFDVSVERL